MLGVAFTFNFGYLMLAFLVPLYAARTLGWSLVQIGAVAALPSMLQLPLRTVSGPLSDVWGECRLLRVAFSAGVASGLCIALVGGGTGLILAQLAIGIARGLYWIPSQSYLTRLPGDRSRAVGLFTSANNAGALLGIVAAGPLVTRFGFPAAFSTASLAEAASLVLALLLAELPRSGPARRIGAAIVGLSRAMLRPALLMAGLTALLSAVPQALVQSFYPIYLVHLGLVAATASLVTSLRSAGVFLAGFLAAGLFRLFGRRATLAMAGGMLALSLVATGVCSQVPAVAAAIAMAGVTSGVLNVLFVVGAAEVGDDSDRGTNIAVTEIFFALSMLLVPLLFGLTARRIQLGPTFVGLGCVIAVLALGLFAVWGRTGRAGTARPSPRAPQPKDPPENAPA